ncbi:secretin N-terminal domain-containing protein [Pseudoalteromonas distincta]|uniref:secretin N-terminal domain-containing protein n=1 Tax=Pseudoalteromonas distincta TaxID=77608 RepID=UPI0034E8D1CA
MHYYKPTAFVCAALLIISGCQSTTHIKNDDTFSAQSSYLKQGTTTQIENAELVNPNKVTPANEKVFKEQQQALRFMPPFKVGKVQTTTADDVLARFSDDKMVTVAADDLLLKDFLHHVLGELLQVSYVLGDEVKTDNKAVTLNLQNEVTEQKLFTLTEKLLSDRGYVMRLNDNIFYIHKDQGNSSKNLVYGYGKHINDIPNTSLDILQMVPFDYGLQASLPNTMRILLGIKAQADISRGIITIQGKRQDIERALELVNMLDRPSMQNRQIGAYKSTYLSTSDLSAKVAQLLDQEGIELKKNGGAKAVLSVVEIETQGALIFFANSEALIERAVFWAKQIDQPIKTTEKQYFLYQPQYSRATDLGVSLEALIGDGSTSRSNTTSAANENSNAFSQKTARSASSKDVKMVVDERANTLIFHTSGEEYQQLLPLIKRLDILPKQVMLEVVIAEVTLQGEFKQGVEFALNRGNYGLSTTGAFMGDGFGGLSYLLQGDRGQVAINLLQTNSLAKILSRPSLVVRDGVSASINVGTDIPIIGETTSDPINGDRQTTSIDYRKTGVELSVTPTVNAQGVVLMEIDQKVSNEASGSTSSGGNPSIFERTIKTEVVAQSGQTIILGGLISENKSNSNSKVPLFGDLPLIGALFRADTESNDRTELVVLVTPRVIESANEWDKIKGLFQGSLQRLTIEQVNN